MKQMMIVAALGVFASSFAQTQTVPVLDTNGLSVRIGGVYPFQKGVRDAMGNPMSLGLDIVAPKSYIKNTTSFISIDYTTKQFGKNPYFIPVMLNAKFGNESESGRSTYGFFGAGLVFSNVGASDTLFGVRGGFGLNMGEHIFAEIAATFSSDKNGSNANNIGFYLGYKF